MLEHE
jgi:peptide chain release factor subunit 3